jgi:hypothetical protein
MNVTIVYVRYQYMVDLLGLRFALAAKGRHLPRVETRYSVQEHSTY